MPDGFSKSNFNPVNGRIISPLILTFVCMWTFWNYKVLFVLFSSMPVNLKFDFIERFLFTNTEVTILYGLIYPFVTTIVFLLLYPYLAKAVYGVWLSRQKEINDLKQSVENNMPITLEESNNIRMALLNMQSRYDDELKKKDAEIAKLKELNTLSARQLENAPNVIMKSVVEVDEHELNILKGIANNKGRMLENNVYKISGLDQVRTDFYLLDLELKGYLKREFDSERNVEYCTLTTRSNKIVSHQIHRTLV